MKGAGGFCWALLLVLYSFIEAAIRYFCPRKKKDISGRTVLITGRPSAHVEHYTL